MKALNIPTAFLSEMSLLYSQHNADYVIVSSSLVHKIQTFILKPVNTIYRAVEEKLRTTGTKTEIHARTIKVF